MVMKTLSVDPEVRARTLSCDFCCMACRMQNVPYEGLSPLCLLFLFSVGVGLVSTQEKCSAGAQPSLMLTVYQFCSYAPSW